MALGNELQSDRHWIGKIRTAVVEVDGKRFDYLTPGALINPSKIVLSEEEYKNLLPRYQIVPFTRKYYSAFWGGLDDRTVNLIGFIPFGFFLMLTLRGRCHSLVVVTLCALSSFSLEAGQIFLPTRFTSTEDLIMNTLGGAIGVFLSRFVR